jgi:hypothetical protein
VIWDDNPSLDSPLQVALAQATLGTGRAERGFELGLALSIRGLADMLVADTGRVPAGTV